MLIGGKKNVNPPYIKVSTKTSGHRWRYDSSTSNNRRQGQNILQINSVVEAGAKKRHLDFVATDAQQFGLIIYNLDIT
jgi:hypothetical protein